MQFTLNVDDETMRELLSFAGDKELLEDAMHFAFDDESRDKEKPVPIELIIRHIRMLKDFRNLKRVRAG